jgi:RNA polymerase sigma-70 factor (ECF subfamily)
VREALEALPVRRRQVFDLVHGRGLSYREAADALEISVQTVANQMSRALRELRERLAHVRGDEPGERRVEEEEKRG